MTRDAILYLSGEREREREEHGASFEDEREGGGYFEIFKEKHFGRVEDDLDWLYSRKMLNDFCL